MFKSNSVINLLNHINNFVLSVKPLVGRIQANRENEVRQRDMKTKGIEQSNWERA
jgi:hypothetical protein